MRQQQADHNNRLLLFPLLSSIDGLVVVWQRLSSYRWSVVLLLWLLLAAVSLLSSCAGLRQQQQHRGTRSNYAGNSRGIIGSDANYFPTLRETMEMVTLSNLIYAFHKEDYGNNDMNNTVCDRINHRHSSVTRPIPDHLTCHWYHHDWTGGTQVMIVSKAATTTTSTKTEVDARKKESYVAIVFAGTDDLRTSLTDADILWTTFGSSTATPQSSDDDTNTDSTYPIFNVSLPGNSQNNIKVHAGFNYEIFDRNNLFGEIVVRTEDVWKQHLLLLVDDDDNNKNEDANNRRPKLYLTGHSLGAANAILTSVGLTQYVQRYKTSIRTSDIHNLNFGAPKTGNHHWSTFVNDYNMNHTIWRFVYGWDLVPRLPELFSHVGHTVQISKNRTKVAATATVSSSQRDHDDDDDDDDVGSSDQNATTIMSSLAYYHHYGNETLQYASVPFGWDAQPYVWVPGALWSHTIKNYFDILSHSTFAPYWMNDFVPTNDNNHSSYYDDGDDNDRPPNVDDDFWVNPPDDDGLEEVDEIVQTLR